MNGYPRTVMDAHRKRRLQQYIDERLNGSRAQFIMLTGYSKGRLAQLLDPTNEEPFGERAARNIAEKLRFSDERWFDKETPVAAAFGNSAKAGVPSETYAPASDLPVSVHRAEDSGERGGIHRIPKLNVAGGQGRGALLPSVEYQSSVIEVSDEWLRANLPGIRISNLRAITGLGPSMHPTFSDGDILFTDVSVTRLVHDRIFALFDKETGELFIKRVTRYPLEECWSITSDNPLHNNPPMADKVSLEKIAAKLGVGGCVVGKWAFTKL